MIRSRGRAKFGGAATAWLSVALLLAVLCIAGLFARMQWLGRASDWSRASESAQSLAKAIEADVLTNFGTLDLALQGVADTLRRADLAPLSPQVTHQLLFDRAATVRHLQVMVVTDAAGNLRFDSRGGAGARPNRAARDYFIHHRDAPSDDAYVGRPLQGIVSGVDIVTLSRRLSRPDGGFDGVVAGAIRLNYFKQLFEATTLGPGSNITLARSDGIVLMRWPYDESFIGRDTSGAELFRHLRHARAGAFETKAVLDGVHRLVVYRQIGELPLVVGIGQSTDVILAPWRRDTVTVGVIVACLCLLTLILAGYLLRELKLRGLAEKRLRRLAQTDVLTGLFNRRHLEQVFARAWRQARQSQKPLALVMIDVDRFKTLNDSFGHRHGDRLLRCLGSSIAATLRPQGEFGARYGGDEFAVLLTDATLARAQAAADAIRSSFDAACRAAALGRPGLSIGIALAGPAYGHEPKGLFDAADAALYRAKANGRNQIVVCNESDARRTAPVMSVAA